jgi:hypothetical protein
MEKQETNVWQRNYFDKPYNNPFLFYVLFGTNNISQLKPSKNKHNINGMPEELEIINYSKENDEQKIYIEGFYKGYLGKCLEEKNGELYKRIISCNNVTVITGEFVDSETFDYLRNTIGIIQALIETEITVILDMQIIKWFEPNEWSEKYFKPKSPQVFDHVNILYSNENGGLWLHTRGMRKFGRPDLSIRNIVENKMELGIEIINRFIEIFAYGLIPNETKEIKIKGMEKGVFGKILGGYENIDFNNYYFEMDKI